MPVTVAHLAARRVESTMSVNNTVARTRSSATSAWCAGEELGDLLERIPPRFDEVVHVAPGQLDVFRARVCGRRRTCLPPAGSSGRPRVGRRALARGLSEAPPARPIRRRAAPHERDGPWGRRQAFVSCPRGPDLFVPRHVRIDRSVRISPVPHAATNASRSLASLQTPLPYADPRSPRATTSAVVRDGCVAANSAACRQRAVDSQGGLLRCSEIVEHRRDAVGPLLQGRQRARRDGIGRAGAWLVEEDQPTKRRHRLDPPLRSDGNSGRTSQHVNQFGTNTMSRAPGSRCAVGDAQVPVHRIARLREHCGSLSRRAGRAVRIGSVYAAHERSRKTFFSNSVPPLTQNLSAAGATNSYPTAPSSGPAPHEPDLHHPPRQPNTVPHPVQTHRTRHRTSTHPAPHHRPRAGHAPTHSHPSTEPHPSHQRRTPTQLRNP